MFGWAAGDDELNIEVLCKFHHCLRNFKHRDKISPKILFFFNPSSVQTLQRKMLDPLMKGTFVLDHFLHVLISLLHKNQLPFMFKKAQTLY